ncbi:MAG: cellulase family glycosylhydrolase [Lentisphaeria bacterium]|jgi:aryl-phospho-beta-D-glucosidase BglC (GH1 family)
MDNWIHHNGFLAAAGTLIRDRHGQGEPVQLCGTNLGGWLVHEPWMTPLAQADDHTARAVLARRFGAEAQRELCRIYQDAWLQESDLENIAALGMNVVRLPVYYRILMEENGEWVRDAAGEVDFARLDWLVNTAWAKGLYTILDLHGAPGSQNGKDHSGQAGEAAFFAAEANLRLAIQWWQAVARHYKDNPAVAGYDLLNEPEGAAGARQWAAYDRIYRAIREVDPHHLIVIEAVWNWEDLPPPADHGWTNVAYSHHYYRREDQSAAAQRELVDWMLAERRRHQAGGRYAVPQLLGEFCLFGELEAWRYGLDQFQAAGHHWLTWTYKVAHPALGNWGLYVATAAAEAAVNPHSDSYAEIARKWGNCQTWKQFRRNDPLAGLIRDVLGRNGGLKRPAPAAPGLPPAAPR